MELDTRIKPRDAVTTTYQYLRLGMVGIVVLLAVSLLIEYWRAGCYQQSISAYYFTPVRAIFVGGLMAIGAALIFISGRTLAEDVCLNIAGMFAPVVAIIPTTEVGECWSTDPPAAPLTADGELAPWVVAGVQNNVPALLVMGVIGLVAVAMLPVITKRQSPWSAFRQSSGGSKAALLIVVLVLLAFAWAYNFWDGFYDHAHGLAAGLMFGFLTLAVGANAWDQRRDRDVWFWSYLGIAVGMPLAALVVFLVAGEWDYAVLVLEAIEIALFLAFWSLQTVRHWDQTIEPAPRT